MDYITCMPWYTTGAAEQRARALVRMVQQAPDVDLQPHHCSTFSQECVCGQERPTDFGVYGIFTDPCLQQLLSTFFIIYQNYLIIS